MRPGVRSPPRPPLQPGAGNGLHQLRGCQQQHAGTATRLRLSRDLASIFCLFLAGYFTAILRNGVPRHSRGDVGVEKRELKVGVHGLTAKGEHRRGTSGWYCLGKCSVGTVAYQWLVKRAGKMRLVP